MQKSLLKWFEEQKEEIRDNWLDAWLAEHPNSCWSCGKQFTDKNPPFWNHLCKIEQIKAFDSVCTTCAARQILDKHNKSFYTKIHPKWIELAEKCISNGV